jgi:hypothetical protein
MDPRREDMHGRAITFRAVLSVDGEGNDERDHRDHSCLCALKPANHRAWRSSFFNLGPVQYHCLPELGGGGGRSESSASSKHACSGRWDPEPAPLAGREISGTLLFLG